MDGEERAINMPDVSWISGAAKRKAAKFKRSKSHHPPFRQRL
jgi:hypothetical protein